MFRCKDAYYRGKRVKINNPISFKRNGQIAKIKWTPAYDSDYVTVIFDDGKSGTYHKKNLIVL